MTNITKYEGVIMGFLNEQEFITHIPKLKLIIFLIVLNDKLSLFSDSFQML